MNDCVSSVIPGVSRVSQIEDNVKASDLPLLTDEQMEKVSEIYQKYIKIHVQNQW